VTGIQPVLYVVACGGPPAAQLDAFAGFAQQHVFPWNELRAALAGLQ
jgi:hypothetical protein